MREVERENDFLKKSQRSSPENNGRGSSTAWFRREERAVPRPVDLRPAGYFQGPRITGAARERDRDGDPAPGHPMSSWKRWMRLGSRRPRVQARQGLFFSAVSYSDCPIAKAYRTARRPGRVGSSTPLLAVTPWPSWLGLIRGPRRIGTEIHARHHGRFARPVWGTLGILR